MPRYVSSTLLALLPDCESQSTIEIAVRDGSFRRYCTGEEPLVLGGNTYTPRLKRVSDLREQLGQAFNRLSATISNIDLDFGLLVADSARKLELADVVVKRFYRDYANPSVNEWVHIFTGKTVNATIGEQFVTFDIIPDTSAAGTCLATETLSPRNGWIFPEVPDQTPPGTGDGGDGGGIVGGGYCFLAGTMILSPRGWQPIETMRRGWNIVNFDEETDEIYTDEIAAMFRHVVTGYFEIGFSNGARLRVTPEHPLLTEFDGFRAVADIEIGQNVRQFDPKGGWSKSRLISSRWISGQPVTVYNLHAAERHNYFANGVAVHNKIGGGGDILQN